MCMCVFSDCNGFSEIDIFDGVVKLRAIPESNVRTCTMVTLTTLNVCTTQVKEKEIFPCDLLLLGSSECDASNTCYVNTKSLDGESDNKLRFAVNGQIYTTH